MLQGLLKIKISDLQDDPGHYLDNYDSHLTRQSPTSTSASTFIAPFSSEEKKRPRQLSIKQLEDVSRKFKGFFLN